MAWPSPATSRRPESVRGLADAVGGTLHVLVNNAGGAFGSEPVESADPDDWRAMFEVNVIGLLQVTQALLPALRASGDAVIVNIGSTAGRIAYEGGGGYTAAKHGTQVVTETLRLELVGEPIRISEIAPGMVRTDEFALVRFDGDREKAEAVYAGVPDPLVAEDIADAIAWIVTRPSHVNIDELVIRPRAQAAQHKVHRIPETDRRPASRWQTADVQTIGLIGGMSWESSAVYYQDLNVGVQAAARWALVAEGGAQHRRLRRGHAPRGRGTVAADRRAPRRGRPRCRTRRRRLPAPVHDHLPQGRRPGGGGGGDPAGAPRRRRRGGVRRPGRHDRGVHRYQGGDAGRRSSPSAWPTTA